MHQDVPDDLIAKYLVGKASREEVKKLQRWLEASEENKVFFHNMVSYWDTESGYFKQDSERVTQRLARKIDESREQRPGPFNKIGKGERSRSGSRRLFLRKIAVAILLVALAFTLFLSVFKDAFSPLEEDRSHYITRVTHPGEKLHMKLPDGSSVKLNASSQLVFPPRFSDRERNVTLIGEAYFEVTEDPDRPFRIQSGNISTTVLGTAFNVRAFPDEKDITVAVVSGRVEVSAPGGEGVMTPATLLTPNEMAVYRKENDHMTKGNFDYMEMVAWKDGIIYFKDACIYEILETLEEWYGVSFQVDRSLDRKKGFTVSYKDKSLETILEGLSFSYGFQFKIEDKIVQIN
ncbi:MAG: FecR domain-containing protein [Cytophagales bacterium]|nr:FecR domain-containing protein [Cytophagales bacterium]